MKFEIVTSGGISSFHLFVMRQYVSGEVQHNNGCFILGRATNCDIVIGQNTISREQCRFFFNSDSLDDACKMRRWYIRDGSDQRESANGTWLCLTDYRVRIFK
jgi:pSer/pThr/pTyr-binding forkhead associated (FHA) protein